MSSSSLSYSSSSSTKRAKDEEERDVCNLQTSMASLVSELNALHCGVDAPLELDSKVTDSAVQLLAYGYRLPITYGDIVKLSAFVSRLPELSCVGHKVYVDMQTKSTRFEKMGAVVVHIAVPCATSDEADECDRSSSSSVKRIKCLHRNDDLSDSDDPPGVLQRVWRFVAGVE